MHHPRMPRRRTHPPAEPARPLTGLLLVAPSKRKKNARELGKLLDKDAADSAAKQPDRPKP
jgi:hypothetical protein